MALDLLGVHEDDAEFEITNEGKIGLFGKVKEEVRIRARIIPTTPRPKKDRGRRRDSRQKSSSKRHGRSHSDRSKPRQSQSLSIDKAQRSDSRSLSSAKHSTGGYRDSSSGSQTRARRGGKRHAESGRYLTLPEQADLAETFTGGVAKLLGITLDFERHKVEKGVMRIDATGKDIGIMIGHRGTTAKAIDSLVRTVLQRSGGTIREGKIRVDIGGLRKRRNEALAEFVDSAAGEVLETGQKVRFEPMSRIDRKIVHDAVSMIDGVESYSEGNDPARYVVVVPS